MKNRRFLAFSILAVLAQLLMLSSHATAQRLPDRQQPTEQQQERPLPELMSREIDPEALRIAVPRECAGIRPDVQTHGNPPDPGATLSPALKSYLTSRNVSPKGYDDPRINVVFADSFKLRSCRVCYATLEVRVKHGPGVYAAGLANWSNDTITVGVAPFTLRFVNGAQIWSATNPNPKSSQFALLPTASLNNYIFSVMPPQPFLDIIAQDDTEFDYAKLTVWYYQ
ncbi:MAG TPA: hypothetical protein VF791_13480 [Pyrinomonadaceae bacterium]